MARHNNNWTRRHPPWKQLLQWVRTSGHILLYFFYILHRASRYPAVVLEIVTLGPLEYWLIKHQSQRFHDEIDKISSTCAIIIEGRILEKWWRTRSKDTRHTVTQPTLGEAIKVFTILWCFDFYLINYEIALLELFLEKLSQILTV